MAFYENEPDRGLHLGRTICVLCRQTASPGSLVLDLRGHEFTVPECERMCVRCRIVPSLEFWAHELCFRLLETSYESNKPVLGDILKFGRAVKPQYKDGESANAASSWEGLFSHYAKPIIESTLGPGRLERLPTEIQIIISDFVSPCWYLTVLGETRRLVELTRSSSHSGQRESLSLTGDIYLSRISYQGISYISRISHMPLEPQPLEPQPLEPQPPDSSDHQHLKLPAHARNLILSKDHIGLRNIQFVDENSRPSADKSPWYEVIKLLPDPCNELHVVSNGLFVRELVPSLGEAYDISRTWSSPTPPEYRPWNTVGVPAGHYLDYVKLDDERVQGLVVCCSDSTNLGFYGYSGMSKSFRKFVALMSRKQFSKFWLFFPINRGESIQAAWIQSLKDCAAYFSHHRLVVQTTLGRTATFGPHLLADLREQYKFNSLLKEDDGVISGLFHDGLDPGRAEVSEFGVTCTENNGTRAKPVYPPFDTQLELPMSYEGIRALNWFMTKAPLHGLVRVRACRDQTQMHAPYIGVLLYYDDCRVESAGQFRWDMDVSLEVSVPVCIRQSDVNGKGYVKDIRNRAECDMAGDGDGEWLELPRSGLIAWWFGTLGNVLCIH
ncbi:hypothetical protein McanMca71_001907 [Microsporum canis]